MANIKPGHADNTIWQAYNLQPSSAAPNHVHPSTYEAEYQSGHLAALPHHGQHQRTYYRSLDISSLQSKSPSQDENGSLSATAPSLNSHHSFSSLKRGFHNTEDSPYEEGVQDFQEEAPDVTKPSINQDHRLLSFSRVPEKQAIIDGNGRIHQIDLSAQIHGMFFLSEMSTPGGDGLLVQPELTCYRRNLFQISGTVTIPRRSLFLITERGERVLLVSLQVSVSASESVDGQPVKLIVIPWKTPPPNSSEVGHGQDNEPRPIPLLPSDVGDSAVDSEMSVYSIAYRRLQFRIATANNGRRRELQQHFTLHLNVVATLANGGKTNICETSTAPIVVRGRSPRNFQARKEIPLVGSSSRGGLPDLHITTSLGLGVTPVSTSTGKPKGSRPQNLELPGSAYSFGSNHHLSSSPSLPRTSAYPTYLGNHQSEHSTAPNTPNYPATSIGIGYLQTDHSNSDLSHSQSPTTTVSGNQPPSRHYTCHSSPVPPPAPPARFMESNPRPAKSPRHIAPFQLPSNSQYAECSAHSIPPFHGTGEPLQRDLGCFPMPVQTWSTVQETSGIYEKAIREPTSDSQQLAFSNEGYVKEGTHPQQHYNWNPA